MSPLESFTIGQRAQESNSRLKKPWVREALNNEESFSKKMCGAAFRQSEVKLPVTSDLSGFSFFTAVLTRSAVKREIVSWDSEMLSDTLVRISSTTSLSISSCSL